MGEDSQRVQTSVIRWVSAQDIMHSMMTIVNNTIVYFKVSKGRF